MVRRYDRDSAGTWAGVIAWNALFAFVPVVLLTFTIFTLLLNHAGFATAVQQRVAGLTQSRSERQAILGALNGFRDRPLPLIAGSLAGMLWSGAALFSALDNALSHLHGCRPRPFWRKRLRGMGLMFPFALLMIPLLGSSTFISVAHRDGLLPRLNSAAIFVIQFVVGVACAVAIFFLFYRLLPNRTLRARQVLPGAVLAGVLLELLSLLFPLYVRETNDVATYGVVFALILLLITFFYLLGQITVIGAVLNAELEAPRAPG